MPKKVVLAYSGGLDTSVIIPWLKEKRGMEVITFSADLGQGEELDPVRDKAKKSGAVKVYIEDLRERFLTEFVFPALKARAAYSNGYLLATALGRPLIGDPDGTAIHRAFVRWQGHGITVQAGRDELLFGDQRFVGNVGWRQHGQSFDGLSVRAPLGAQWKLSYAFLESVQRINRATDELSGHLLALEGDLGGAGKLLLHAERLDYESPARRALSSLTWGAEWSGVETFAAGRFLWELEAAAQRDAAKNPRPIDAGYFFASAGWGWRGWTARAGWERLEGSARKGQFNTPLATLHKFNGWADRFTATPIDGLDDRYLQLDGQRGAWSWTLAAHDFAAGTGGASYGRELDLQLLWRPKSGLTFGAKSARYDARRYGAETTKLWVWTAFSL